MSKFVFKSGIFLFLVLCLNLTGFAQNKTVVRIDIHPESIVGQTFYTLADISSISSANDTLTNDISKIKFGMSPAPGMSHKITAAAVMSRLRQYEEANELRLHVPENAIVSRKSIKVTISQIESILLSKLQQNRYASGKNYKPVSPIKAVILPAGNFNYDISEILSGKKVPMISYKIDYLIDNRVEKTVNYAFRDTTKKSAGNAQINAPKTTQTAKQTIQPVKNATGSEAGLPQKSNHSDAMIRSGNRIKIVFNSGAIKLVVEGIASETGNIGDMISVVNIDSKKTVIGKIMDSGTVAVL